MYERLRSLRLEKGLRGEDMASLLKMSKANYSKKENGEVKFSINEAHAISEKLKLPIEQIFFEK